MPWNLVNRHQRLREGSFPVFVVGCAFYLMMEENHQFTRRHIPEYCTLNVHTLKNLVSCYS